MASEAAVVHAVIFDTVFKNSYALLEKLLMQVVHIRPCAEKYEQKCEDDAGEDRLKFVHGTEL